jgi:hypothetical protein
MAGGPVRLGFDVVCYHRETDNELWRVVFEGLNKRLKVYPDGRAERFDGKENFPKFQPLTEVLRIAPSKDKGKIDAAVSAFKWYAAESISFTALAHHLNKLGWRNGYGGHFQGQQIEAMLGDPIYLGYYTWNRSHAGKFHRYTNGRTVLELNYGEKVSKNERGDWVQSRRLFKPQVDQKTWDTVQRKLAERTKRTRAPRSASQYLSGLVYCGNCGCRMVAGPTRRPKSKPRKDGFTGDRYEYFCGSYFKAIKEKWPVVRRDGMVTRVNKEGQECKCLRNGVFQDQLVEYVRRYLEETGRRLQLLSQGRDESHVTDRLKGQEEAAWWEYREGLDRLEGYLAQHHPEEYNAILREFAEQAAADALEADPSKQVGGATKVRDIVDRLGERGRAAYEKYKAKPATPGGFTDACLACYRSVFDPAAVEAELAKQEAAHTALTEQCLKLTTPRAVAKANQQLAELESQIARLEQQRQDLADLVERHWREILDLGRAIAEARRAMESGTGERALRQRAEALRAIVHRIECTFTATGQTGAGWGKKNARLVAVTFYPVVGDSVAFSADSKGTLMYSSAHSRMKRTRSGRTR